MVKNLPASAGDPGSIPRSRRSPGEGHGKPLQYSSSKILWTEEAGGLHFIGSQRVRHIPDMLSCVHEILTLIVLVILDALSSLVLSLSNFAPHFFTSSLRSKLG